MRDEHGVIGANPDYLERCALAVFAGLKPCKSQCELALTSGIAPAELYAVSVDRLGGATDGAAIPFSIIDTVLQMARVRQWGMEL